MASKSAVLASRLHEILPAEFFCRLAKRQSLQFCCFQILLRSCKHTFFFFIYIPLKIYKTNYLLQYLLITLQNTTRTIIPRGAIDYDNPVAINIERNKNYRVNQERCTARPQSRTQEPPTDLHNSFRIYDVLKRLFQKLCPGLSWRIWD